MAAAKRGPRIHVQKFVSDRIVELLTKKRRKTRRGETPGQTGADQTVRDKEMEDKLKEEEMEEKPLFFTV